MRHSHHAAGSAAAQADLPSMSGRRSFLGNLMVGGAAFSVTGLAIVLPAIGRAQSVQPVAGKTTARMAELIAELTRLSASLNVAEDSGDLKVFDRAAEARRPALEALVFERPESMIDLAAKMTALSQFMQDEDSEGYVFRRLSQDAVALAGGGVR